MTGFHIDWILSHSAKGKGPMRKVEVKLNNIC